jgi:hypothetical protein
LQETNRLLPEKPCDSQNSYFSFTLPIKNIYLRSAFWCAIAALVAKRKAILDEVKGYRIFSMDLFDFVVIKPLYRFCSFLGKLAEIRDRNQSFRRKS